LVEGLWGRGEGRRLTRPSDVAPAKAGIHTPFSLDWLP
jgi:hypothetical protein